MGVEPFLVASSLLMVLAQRLVRRLCPECKTVTTPTAIELADFGVTSQMLAGSTVYKANGCPTCLQTGYKGRTGIYEVLEVNDSVRRLVQKEASGTEIKKLAVAGGMKTLRDDGVRKVLEGTTSFEEVLRVTQEDAR